MLQVLCTKPRMLEDYKEDICKVNSNYEVWQLFRNSLQTECQAALGILFSWKHLFFT